MGQKTCNSLLIALLSVTFLFFKLDVEEEFKKPKYYHKLIKIDTTLFKIEKGYHVYFLKDSVIVK